MDLITYLRQDLAGLMRSRDAVALRAIRDAIGAIQNAGITHRVSPEAAAEATDLLARGVSFGLGERIVAPVADVEALALARAEVTERHEQATLLRSVGQHDRAATLDAEALALSERLAAYVAA